MRRFLLTCAAMCGVWLLAEPALAQRSTPQQLTAPGGAANGYFGNAVAVDGDTMVVGAYNSEMAHVYRWTATGWTFEAALSADDGGASIFFGGSVAVAGEVAIIGAPGENGGRGAVYVFHRVGTMWTHEAKLVASDRVEFAFFGRSIAISGNSVLVGADWDMIGINWQQGSVYVFTRTGSIWTQQAKLTASDGGEYYRFGHSVAVEGDVALIGAPESNVGGNPSQGAAYIFTRSGTTWTQQAKLTAPDGESGDEFGLSVGLSGTTAVIGAASDDAGVSANQGSAYVFTGSCSAWTQQAKLTAPDGAAEDFFGLSVCIDGETAIAGSHGNTVNGNARQGSAHIFTRSGATWTRQTKLTAPDGATEDAFGYSVAISGDTALIGAGWDDIGTNVNQGSSWVFSRAGDVWIGPDFKIIAPGVGANERFGWSVAVSGDTALIGVLEDRQVGYAYVFTRSGAIWVQQARLGAIDVGPYDMFGSAVSLSGNTALIGAFNDDVGVNGQEGSAYVFVRSGTTWMLQAKLAASDGAWLDKFGYSVSICGDTALVGAYGEDSVPGGDVGMERGSVYVFVRTGTTWAQQAKLTLAPEISTRVFGKCVALAGDTALIGAPGEGVGIDLGRGAAYVFSRTGTAWAQQARLSASDGSAGYGFGTSVALSGGTALVGSPGWGGNEQGAAYVFALAGTTWSQEAELMASDHTGLDHFGASVALCDDTALIGSPDDDIDGRFDQGSVYVFYRSGTLWTELTKFTAPDGEAGDQLGRAVATAGSTALAGAPNDDILAESDHGSAYAFSVTAADLPLAINQTLGTTFASLSAAVLAAQSGQQITATPAAWRGVSSLDTAGRTLLLGSLGDLRTLAASTLTLGNASSISTPASDSMSFFGSVRVSADAGVSVESGSFLLGSRGTLTASADSSLVIDATSAELQGGVVLEQGASLVVAGEAMTSGRVEVWPDADLAALVSVTNGGVLSIVGGSVTTPLLRNRALMEAAGGAVLGSFRNELGAAVAIRPGTLSILSDFTSDGAIAGSGDVPALEVGGSFVLGAGATLAMPCAGSWVRIGGSFGCAIAGNTRYDMSVAELRLQGAGPEQTLEVMSTDIGPDGAGLDRSLAGHFPVGVLRIGPALSTVRLVDEHDNDGRGQSVREAIYVDTLRIEPGSRLANGAFMIYYNTLDNLGVVDAPDNLVPIAPRCPADFNQDGGIDGADVQAFFAAWETGSPAADVNQDGGVDGTDVEVFFAAWESGVC